MKTALEQISEGRKAKGRVYLPSLLLCLMTLSKLCDYHAYAEIARFVRNHRYLMGMLGFTSSDVPCDDTFRYMVKHIDMEAYEASVYGWAQQELAGLAGEKQGEALAAYVGKTLRGSKDVRSGQQAIHLLSLVQQDYRTTIAHEQTSKGREIAAAETLLSNMNLAGMVITADALLTQKGITSIIKERQGRYLLVVKDNQRHAKELLAEVFREDLPPSPRAATRLAARYARGGLKNVSYILSLPTLALKPLPVLPTSLSLNVTAIASAMVKLSTRRFSLLPTSSLLKPMPNRFSTGQGSTGRLKTTSTVAKMSICTRMLPLFINFMRLDYSQPYPTPSLAC